MYDFLFHEDYYNLKNDSIYKIADKILEGDVAKYKNYSMPLLNMEMSNNENLLNAASGVSYSKDYLSKNSVNIPEIGQYINYEDYHALQDLYDWLFPTVIIFIILTIIFLFIKKGISIFFGICSLIFLLIVGNYFFYGEKKMVNELYTSIDWNEFKRQSNISGFSKRYAEVYVPKNNYVTSSSKTYKIKAKSKYGYDYYEGEIVLKNDEIENAYIINDGKKIELDLDWSGDREFKGSDNSNNEYNVEFD